MNRREILYTIWLCVKRMRLLKPKNKILFQLYEISDNRINFEEDKKIINYNLRYVIMAIKKKLNLLDEYTIEELKRFKKCLECTPTYNFTDLKKFDTNVKNDIYTSKNSLIFYILWLLLLCLSNIRVI